GAALIYVGYDEGRKRSAYFLAFALFVLGLLTKTAVVILPPVLLVLFWWKRGKLSWERDLKPLVPFFIAAAAAGIVTVWVEQRFCTELGETFAFSMIDRCLIAGRLFWFYLGKLLWPANLVPIYPAWNISSHVWWQYLFRSRPWDFLSAYGWPGVGRGPRSRPYSAFYSCCFQCSAFLISPSSCLRLPLRVAT